MTAISCNIIRQTLTASLDVRVRGTYSVEYRVVSNDESDSPLEVMDDCQAGLGGGNDTLPAHGDSYSFGGSADLGSFVSGLTAWKPDGVHQPTEWRVMVTYQPPQRIPGGGGYISSQTVLQTGDPLAWPVQFRSESIEEEIELTTAKNIVNLDHLGRAPMTDGPIVNTAGHQLSTPVMVSRFRLMIGAVKNFASEFDIWSLDRRFANTMNREVVNIPAVTGAMADSYEKYTLRYIDTRALGEQQRAGSATLYYPAKIRLEFNVDTWDIWLPNEGFKQIVYGPDGPFKLPQPCLMEETEEAINEDTGLTFFRLTGRKVPVTEPVFLDELGSQRPPGEEPTRIKYRHLNPVEYRGSGTSGLGIGLT